MTTTAERSNPQFIGRRVQRVAAQGGYPMVSLNVRTDNPVVRLYERAGCVKVEGSEIINRTGGVSFTMIHTLES